MLAGVDVGLEDVIVVLVIIDLNLPRLAQSQVLQCDDSPLTGDNPELMV